MTQTEDIFQTHFSTFLMNVIFLVNLDKRIYFKVGVKSDGKFEQGCYDINMNTNSYGTISYCGTDNCNTFNGVTCYYCYRCKTPQSSVKTSCTGTETQCYVLATTTLKTKQNRTFHNINRVILFIGWLNVGWFVFTGL